MPIQYIITDWACSVISRECLYVTKIAHIRGVRPLWAHCLFIIAVGLLVGRLI